MNYNIKDMWTNTLSVLEEESTPVCYRTWFKTLEPISIEDNVMVLQTIDPFYKKIIQKKYVSDIQKAIFKSINEEFAVQIITKDDLKSFFTAAPSKSSSTRKNNSEVNLNPKYTFDTFVVGNSNRMAHAASLAVAESPAEAYNPLFIYGGAGLGKTHLMQSIGHYILNQNQDTKVIYVSSEKFTNELITAIQEKTTPQFRNKFRNIDVLLIDDIQFISGKESTQEEFFHTFNTLHDADKQIIISSDRPPKEIEKLEERMRSRFEWGLIADIQQPDFETRVAILNKKAKMENIQVDNQVLHFIAKHIFSNIRELEGALNRIVAFSVLANNEQITIDLAREALKDLMSAEKQRVISSDLIQKTVAEYFNLKPEDLRSKKRTRSISYPRQIAMYLCRTLTDLSLPKIGESFGGRDHTTVLHGFEKIENELKKDSDLEQSIEILKNQIVGN